MTDVRASWEDRASNFGDELAGVLFRGLSVHANKAIDEWHSWLVREVFLEQIPLNGRVLDLGCGYGRLSLAMSQKRQDIVLTGVDISTKYCRMYEESVGAAVCADLANLPFEDGTFDGVLAVTSLMYSAQDARAMILAELARIAKPTSTLLLLDPGLELQRLVAFVRGSKSESPTGGHGFGRDEYLAMTRSAGFTVEAMGGNRSLSGLLLIPGVGESDRPLIKRALGRMAQRDCKQGGYSAMALHRWVLARRAGETRD